MPFFYPLSFDGNIADKFHTDSATFKILHVMYIYIAKHEKFKVHASERHRNHYYRYICITGQFRTHKIRELD